MDCIHASVVSESRSYRVWTEVFCNLRIHGAAEFSERSDSVFLSDFHHNARARGHLLNHTNKLRQNTLVDFEELFGSRLVKSEHLHGRDFKSFLQNHVNNLSSKALLDNVGLNDSASAIIKGSSRAELL